MLIWLAVAAAVGMVCVILWRTGKMKKSTAVLIALLGFYLAVIFTFTPWWWTAYNKVKHNRTSLVEIDGKKQEGYKFANQKYTMLALAGLYQIMVYLYQKLATDEGKKIVTPMPGSRLFKLIGGVWDSISFYGDSAFYINDGDLIWETSTIHY